MTDISLIDRLLDVTGAYVPDRLPRKPADMLVPVARCTASVNPLTASPVSLLTAIPVSSVSPTLVSLLAPVG